MKVYRLHLPGWLHATSIVALLAVSAGCQSGIARFGQFAKRAASRDNASQLAQKPQTSTGHAEPEAKLPAAKDLDANSYAEIQLALARSLTAEGNLAAAEKALDACRRNDPQLYEAIHHLALVKEKQGKYDESRRLFQEALVHLPNSAELNSDYGYCCYLREDWAQAEKYFRRAIELAPTSQRAHNNLGLVLVHLDRSDEALAHFSAAGLSPAAARTNIAFAMARSRKIEDARQQLKLALKREPKLEQAQQVAMVLDRIVTESEPTEVAAQPTEKPLSAVSVRLGDPQIPSESGALQVRPVSHTVSVDQGTKTASPAPEPLEIEPLEISREAEPAATPVQPSLVTDNQVSAAESTVSCLRFRDSPRR